MGVTDNWVGTSLLLLGLGFLGFAYWAKVIYWLGFPTTLGLKTAIRDWALETSFSVAERRVEQTHHFCLDLTALHEEKVTISRSRDEPEFVRCGIKIQFRAEAKTGFGNASDQSKASAIHNLRLELARLGVEYVMAPNPMDGIHLSAALAADRLDKAAFLNLVFFVIRGIHICREVMGYEVRAPAASVESEAVDNPTP